jgi:hypothetical protein
MTGQAHWLVPVLVVGGGLLLLLAAKLLSRPLALLVRRQRRFACPKSGRMVDCTIVEDTLTGTAIKVERCSAFDPPDRVRCAEYCLHEAPRVARQAASRPN